MNILQIKSSWVKVTYFLITVVALSLIVIGCSSTAGDEQGDIIEDERLANQLLRKLQLPCQPKYQPLYRPKYQPLYRPKYQHPYLHRRRL